MHSLPYPDIREGVRRRLGLPTASDKGGPQGDPGSMPRPTNPAIDHFADAAYTDIDDDLTLAPRIILALDIAAQTDAGPYIIALDSELWQPRPPSGGISALVSATWEDSGSAPGTPLEIMTYDIAIGYWQRLENDPGGPHSAWLDAGQLWLYPAPSAAGTLNVTVKATATVVPVGFPMEAFVDIVARDVCAAEPGDVEMQNRLKWLAPKGGAALSKIRRWLALQNEGAIRGRRPWQYRRTR